jgi:16S rRNA (guanine527-N7)-methyltransferase
MSNIPSSQIRDELAPYGFVPDDTQSHSINLYISLLLRWNQRVSLTTVTNPTDILRFHFGESLYAAVCVPILDGRLADVGSGAGFPGLPLRLARPDLELTMIESNMKKAAFLREVIRQLALGPSKVIRERMEDASITPSSVDFVTARALGNHFGTLEWSRTHLARGGKIALWLGEQDVAPISSVTGWSWSAPVHIPGSKRRFILAGSPSS